jgi:hypothetical protein
MLLIQYYTRTCNLASGGHGKEIGLLFNLIGRSNL